MGRESEKNSRRTKIPAIVQLPHGRLDIPNSWGSVFIMYSNVMKPGASIVIHAILPGMFKRDSTDVLP